MAVDLNSVAKRRVGVVGAGMAGILCAQRLRRRGLHPVVYEKSRGVGGRLASRRVERIATFDHGAQYVTARSPDFRACIDDLAARGAAGIWRPMSGEDDTVNSSRWIVGTPAMNCLVKPLAEGLDLRLDAEVSELRRDEKGWRIYSRSNEPFDRVDVAVTTVPAPQASALLRSQPNLIAPLDNVSIEPCWALMIAFETVLQPGFDCWRSDSRAIAWMARNSSKPGRSDSKDCWVVHASPDWSRENLEADRDLVVARLTEELRQVVTGDLPEIAYVAVHRWRYAMTSEPLGRPFHRSDDGMLFIGGDWCLGARVDYAFQSGAAIADAIIAALTEP